MTLDLEQRQLVIDQRARHLRKIDKAVRTEVQDNLRDAIDGEEALKTIGEACASLMEGYEMRDLFGTGEKLRVQLTDLRTAQVKAGADIAFRMLGKILPDLKSVELVGSPGGEGGGGMVVVTYIPRTPNDPIAEGEFTEVTQGVSFI